MSISERVARLRAQSLETKESISAERAQLMTAFYQQELGLLSVPMQRALSFKHLMQHKTACINEGELREGLRIIDEVLDLTDTAV